MTFGFDANGRMVLYYVAIGGGLRKITPTTPAASSARNDLRMIPVTPFRAYDTGPNEPAVGVARRQGVQRDDTPRSTSIRPARTRRRSSTSPTTTTPAPGSCRLWGTHALRPATSSLNADAADTIGANAAIVPLDGAGRFMLESTITGRVIVDVMAWLDDTGGAVSAGRFVALDPAAPRRHPHPGRHDARIGQRQPVHATRRRHRVRCRRTARCAGRRHGVGGRALDRRHRRAGSGRLRRRLPDRYDVEQHLQRQRRRRATSAPTWWSCRSAATGTCRLKTLNIADVVVDVLGYITSASAPASTSGRYSSIDSIRIVDTRVPRRLRPAR